MIPPASFSDRNESQLPGTRRPLEANTGGESDSNIHPLSTIPPHQQSDHGSSLLQFRFSVNKQGKNKDWDYRLLTKCFEDTVGTIEDLADFVLKGFAVSGAWLGGKQRKSKNCLGIQVILLDFDNSKLLRDNHGKALKDKNGNQIRVYDPQYLIEHAKADPNFQSLCGFAYTSPSHQLDWHRFRVVIPLARWITKQADIDAIISWCQQQFPGCDLSCKDRARAFFGNTNADIIAINPTAGISEEQLERILAETCAEKAGYVQKRQWHLLPDLNPQDRWQLIKSAIDSIDPDCSYDEWLAVGMALRSLGEQWLSVWDEWSAQGAKYRPGECERKWRGFSTTSGITLGTLFWLGKKYGWSFPQRDSSKAFARIKQRMEAIMLSAYRQEITLEQMEFELSTLRGQAFNARVSNNQWLGLRYELEERIFHSSNAREQFQEWQGFKQLKQWLKRLQKLSGRAEGFGGRRQSQPKSKPPLKTIEYQPGKLPKSCEYITPPKVLYKSNQLPQLIQEARAAGWKDLLDTTTPGGGKSYRYAMLSLSTLGVNDGGRAWLLSQGHRNPTTAPAEHNYADMPVRSRSGFVVDPERKTATGKPYLRYPTTEEAKFLPQGNCHLADLIHAAAAKRIESASEEAQLNPFCAICKHRGYCGQHSGPGYGYRYERRDLFENQYQVRSSLDSLPKPSSYHYGHDAAILDEPLQQLKPVRVINADITDLLAQWDELGYQLPQVAAQLAPLKTALMPLIRGVNIPYYGLNHEQLLPLLPPVPEGFIDTLARIRVAMSVDVAVLNRDTPDLVSTQEDIDKIASLKAKIKRRSEKLEKLRAELFELQQVEDELRMVGQQLSLEVEFLGFRYTSAEALKLLERRQKLPELLAEVETELVQFRAQLEQQECTRQTVKDVNRRQYQEAKRSLQESIEALPNQWLVPFLEVWGGQSRGAIRIDRFGLKLAVLDNRHNQVLNSLKTRYYLDATATPQILALYRQIPVSQILWIELEQPPVDNLDFVWVTGMGLASKNRSESCDQRLKILHATLREKHPDLVIFDWKAKKEVLGANGHYFSDSTRGTNEFIERTAIVAIGLPMPDIASYYGFWLTTKTDNSLSFDDFYRQLIDAEIIQAVGRLRANRRSHQKLTFYLVGDTEKCRLANYQPPAQLQPRRVEVRGLCPAAASKAEQAWLGIWEVIEHWWTECGKLPTQEEVSEQTGINRSWISKLAAQFVGGWKCLKKVIWSLVNPPYNSWNRMEACPEDVKWIANTYLPLVAQNTSLEAARELNALLQACGEQAWVQILNWISPSLRLNLIAAMFRDGLTYGEKSQT